MTTERATYFLDQELVKAPGRVVIETEMLHIEGTQLEAKVEEQMARLLKNVQSTIKPKKAKKS